jgi:translation initiation factor 1
LLEEQTESIANTFKKEPMICKFEKRKGKATTTISYEGTNKDFKIAKEIKLN